MAFYSSLAIWINQASVIHNSFVQRKATKFLLNNFKCDYKTKNNNLNVTSHDATWARDISTRT